MHQEGQGRRTVGCFFSSSPYVVVSVVQEIGTG